MVCVYWHRIIACKCHSDPVNCVVCVLAPVITQVALVNCWVSVHPLHTCAPISVHVPVILYRLIQVSQVVPYRTLVLVKR